VSTTPSSKIPGQPDQVLDVSTEWVPSDFGPIAIVTVLKRGGGPDLAAYRFAFVNPKDLNNRGRIAYAAQHGDKISFSEARRLFSYLERHWWRE
jgi:hypothetical protein